MGTPIRRQRNIVVLGFSMVSALKMCAAFSSRGCVAQVGKTAICLRFVNDRFDERCECAIFAAVARFVEPSKRCADEPTYESSYSKNWRHKGQDVECIIKDTQGLVSLQTCPDLLNNDSCSQSDQEIFRNEYGLVSLTVVLIVAFSDFMGCVIRATTAMCWCTAFLRGDRWKPSRAST